MKAEINVETKVKLFALYIGQKVLKAGVFGLLHQLNVSWNWRHESFHLKLKPLSSITDEDAAEVAKICYSYNEWVYSNYNDFLEDAANEGKVCMGRFVNNEESSISMIDHLQTFDFLRSRGYALPFMGLSVEEMAEAGWIKLVP